MIKLNIQRIKPELEPVIQAFNSGNQYLDNFIKSSAASNDSIGKTTSQGIRGDCVCDIKFYERRDLAIYQK